MALTINHARMRLLPSLLLTLAATTAYGTAPTPVGIYTVCDSPDRLQMAFRNKSNDTLVVPEGLLPWNNFFAIKARSFYIENGKAISIEMNAPIADYMRKIRIPPNRVISGELYFREIIKDFDQIIRKSDIFIEYSLAPGKGLPHSFASGPVLVVVPKEQLFSKKCPAIVPLTWH